MPELPDVEAIRLNIEPDVVGRVFTGVTLHWPKAIKTPSAGEFRERLKGAVVSAVKRRAKYFLFELDRSETLIVHLKMTGSLRVTPKEEEHHRFTRTIFHLENCTELRFVDPRKLGAMWLVQDAGTVIGGLGPEPLEAEFTANVLAGALEGKSAPVKALLCDQSLIAGIGNIYADDILYTARIHPLRPGKSLRDVEIEVLRMAIQDVLMEAIERLIGLLPEDAPPTEALGMEVTKIPRQAKAACHNCGGEVERIMVRSRGTYFCPRCQPLKPQRIIRDLSMFSQN